jgi:hypothetical protein
MLPDACVRGADEIRGLWDFVVTRASWIPKREIVSDSSDTATLKNVSVHVLSEFTRAITVSIIRHPEVCKVDNLNSREKVLAHRRKR